MKAITLKECVFIDGGYVRGFFHKEANEEMMKGPQKYAAFIFRIIEKFVAIARFGALRQDLKIFYYDAIVTLEDDPEKHKERKEFFDKVQERIPYCEVKLGDCVESKKNKRKKRFKQKRVDTLIAVDMITKAFLKHYEHAILLSGDRDFVSVVEAIKNYTGKRVTGIYEPESVARDLELAYENRKILPKNELFSIYEECFGHKQKAQRKAGNGL